MQLDAESHSPSRPASRKLVALSATLCLVAMGGVFAAAMLRDDRPRTEMSVAETSEFEPVLGIPVEGDLLVTRTNAIEDFYGEPADREPTKAAAPSVAATPAGAADPPPEPAPVPPPAEPLEAAATATVPVPEVPAPAAVAPPAESGAVEPSEVQAVSGDEEVAEQRQELEEAPVPCGPETCAPGLVCCNPSCGFCAEAGASCPQYSCASVLFPSSSYCGTNTCNVGEVCCNPSCGTCVRPGQSCDTAPCTGKMTMPVSYACGMVTCNTGMVCCNPSCGICARPGESCSREVCD
jgi:hypothetical protein